MLMTSLRQAATWRRVSDDIETVPVLPPVMEQVPLPVESSAEETPTVKLLL